MGDNSCLVMGCGYRWWSVVSVSVDHVHAPHDEVRTVVMGVPALPLTPLSDPANV
jgi:hypothetical protein